MNHTTITVPVWKSIEESWQKVKGSKSTFMAAMLLNLIIIYSFYLPATYLEKNAYVLSHVLSMLSDIVTYLTTIGVIYIGIRRAQNLPISYKMMFRCFQFNISLNLILSYCLQLLALAPGIILMIIGVVAIKQSTPHLILIGGILIIFGICIAALIYTRLLLAPLFIIENTNGPIEAIKLSYRATRGNVWRLIGLLLIGGGLVFLCVFTLMIGIIWVYPLVCITQGTVYEKLKANL